MEYRIESENMCEENYQCKECGKQMNPIEKAMNDVCGDCVRKKHREVTRKKM